MAFLTTSTSNLTAAMSPKRIAQMALTQLTQSLNIVPRTQPMFEGVTAGEVYRVPILSGLTAYTRSAGSAVTDQVSTIAYEDIPFYQYETTQVFDESFLSNDAGTKMMMFVDQAVSVIAEKIETVAAESITQDSDLVLANFIDSTQAAARFETVQAAALAIRAAKLGDGDWQAAVTPTALNSLLAEAEFSQYNTMGFPGVYRDGLPVGNLYGFNTLYNNALYNGYSAVTFQAAEAIDGSETAIDYDTNSTADVHPEPGDVLLCESEKMIVVSNSITSADAGTVTVIRGALGTSAASHADDTAITRVAGYNNLFWKKQAIVHVFPPQDTASRPGVTKVEAVDPVSGMRVYVLTENRPGYNGGVGVTVSCNFGIKVVRPTGVYRFVSAA